MIEIDAKMNKGITVIIDDGDSLLEEAAEILHDYSRSVLMGGHGAELIKKIEAYLYDKSIKDQRSTRH